MKSCCGAMVMNVKISAEGQSAFVGWFVPVIMMKCRSNFDMPEEFKVIDLMNIIYCEYSLRIDTPLIHH